AWGCTAMPEVTWLLTVSVKVPPVGAPLMVASCALARAFEAIEPVVAPLKVRKYAPTPLAKLVVIVWTAFAPVMLFVPVSVTAPAPPMVRPPVPVSVLLMVVVAPLLVGR